MRDELMRQVRGEVRPARLDRAAVGRAKDIYDDVREAAFVVDGLNAFAAHTMEGARSLDQHRQMLERHNPNMGGVLQHFERNALHAAEQVQLQLTQRLTTNWF